MDCQEIQSQMGKYDFTVSFPTKITEHLEQCQICARVVDELKLVDACLKESLQQPLSQFLPPGFISRGYKKIQLREQRLKNLFVYKIVAAAAVVLVGLVVYSLFVSSPPSHILEGTLCVETEGEKTKVLESFDSFPIGQTVKTLERQSAKIKLRDGSVIEMSSNTILTLQSDSRLNGRLLSLEEGELHCQVAKGGGFRIQMPGAELKTLGTEFTLRMSTNKKEITTSRDQTLSFITSATVKVVVSSGKVSLTTQQDEKKLQQHIKAGETVIRDVNPPFLAELQTEIKDLINQLGNENEVIREKVFTALIKIGYVIVPFLETILPHTDSIQQPYINRLLEKFKGPELLWSHEIPETGLSLHPLVVSAPPSRQAGNQLYLVTGSGLYALDRLQGSVNWKFQQDNFNSAPLVVDAIVYIGTLDGGFFAIESKEGKIIWKQAGLGAIQSTPTIYDNTIYIGSGEPKTNRGKFYALDAETGQIKWVFNIPGIVAASQAIISESLVLFGAWDNQLYALHTQTGEKRWVYRTNGKIVTSPVIADNLVYVGSEDGKIYVLSGQDGQERWSFQADSAILESPVKVSKTLYWGTEHKIYALDLETRNIIWTYNREGFNIGTIIVKEEKLYLGTDSGKLVVLDATSGQKLWRYDMPGDNNVLSYFYKAVSSPAIFNNMLYVTTRSIGPLAGNKIYALKLPR